MNGNANTDNSQTYNELLLENEALRGEIIQLKQQLSKFCSPEPLTSPENIPEQAIAKDAMPALVNKFSRPDEKIELFMGLFAGRDDVFARRFVSKRTGKSGYAPVCGNEWQTGLCEKPKIKCAKCPNRKLLPLTPQVIYRHLRGQNPQGEDVIGIYPMLPDETCRFLVADFDGAHWQEDVLAFKKICAQHDLDIALERSRSGAGGHIWFFFEEAIFCALARRLASGLLTAVMEERHELSFASYDRLLPNQDTLPSGGFGNLIALPLQGLARKSGNSEFIDDTFTSHPDQWAYLACVRKIPINLVDELAQTLNNGNDLGTLAATDPEAKPWEQKPLPTLLTKDDFPSSLNIVRANGLYVQKSVCSERALGRIKRLAAFKNPDFYKVQSMRLPTYQKPRIICTAVETDEYVCLPRGLESNLITLLEDAGTAVTVENKTETGRQINVEFTDALRDEQAAAARALLEHHNGVLSATTAFGKTVTAAYLIASLKVNALILVHTQALMNQWQRSLERFLRIEEPLPEQAKGKAAKKHFRP